MRPILDEAQRATGVRVILTLTGTLDGIQSVISGKTDGNAAIWFSSDRYLELHPGAEARVSASTPIMSSPVLLGLDTPVTQRLGWDHQEVTWADIADAAGARRFDFGMTNPAHSNSGLSALVSIATGVAGNGAALTTQEFGQAAPALRGFFSAQALTSSSSGYLTDAYLRAQSGPPGSAVDGLVDYESELLSLNQSGKLRQPLTLIYPKDGVVTADYPLALLTSAQGKAGDAYHRLVTYLREPAVQREIMEHTWRRPIISCGKLDARFGNHLLFELPFPARPDVVDDLIAVYLNTFRRPARVVCVLDTSGSMAQYQRMDHLKEAIQDLTGTGTSPAAQVNRFHNREQVTMLPFSTVPGQPTTFDIPASAPESVLAQIRAYISSLTPGGWTAIYDSLVTAYDSLGTDKPSTHGWITSIVLLTDGENNQGRGYNDFAAFYRRLPASLASVPVDPILFGDNNITEMRKLAALTGGHVFDGRTASLVTVFANILGEQ
jgi:Ca-activated chloride channel family protein